MRAWQVLVNLFSVVAVELHQIDWIGGPTTQRQYIYAVSVQRLQAHISMPAFFFFLMWVLELKLRSPYFIRQTLFD